MEILATVNQDLKGIGKIGEGHINLLLNLINNSSSKEELAKKIDSASKDGKIQFVVLTILMVLADTKGRNREGQSTFADSILDEQSRKIKRYGEKAYRLSENQVLVIVNSVWDWLKF